MGHTTFLVPRDISLWTDKILPLVEEANERPAELAKRRSNPSINEMEMYKLPKAHQHLPI